MNSEIAIFFSSIVLTCFLTGFLGWYAWKQRKIAGAGAYALMGISICLLALVEIISMLSRTEGQALAWFNVRFIFNATIPVFWCAFAMAYTGQPARRTKTLTAIGLFISLITQVLLWTNGFHHLWVTNEVAFHQNGLLWVVETSQRVSGAWFWVHTIFGVSLELTGAGLIMLGSFRKKLFNQGQAVLLTAGALVGILAASLPTLNLLPLFEFNLYIPGIGLGELLHLFAVLRFQFLKNNPT